MSKDLHQINQMIQGYFEYLHKSHSEVNRQGILTGWLEDIRARVFQNSIAENMETIHSIESINLRIPMIRFYHNSFIVILAIHDDTVLWLDNHVNNDDYSKYMVTERLFERLPQNASSYAQCIIESKLTYLGEPRIIGNIDELPATESLKSKRTKSDTIQKLESIAKYITPPVMIADSTTLLLVFCIWTRIRGNVFKVKCTWDGTKFNYSGQNLMKEIGDYVMLR